jgi:hypothetical protein
MAITQAEVSRNTRTFANVAKYNILLETPCYIDRHHYLRIVPYDGDGIWCVDRLWLMSELSFGSSVYCARSSVRYLRGDRMFPSTVQCFAHILSSLHVAPHAWTNFCCLLWYDDSTLPIIVICAHAFQASLLGPSFVDERSSINSWHPTSR